MERKFENTRIIEACDSFSIHNTTIFLQEMNTFGVLDVKYSGKIKQFVFSYGDQEQIFSPLEIRLMDRFGETIVFEDFFEATDSTDIRCRIIALKFRGTLEEETCLAIGIGKILDKCLDGFTVCFFFSDDRIYVGCNKFSNDNTTNFVLSQPIYNDEQLEYLEDNLYYLDDRGGFLEYYLSFLQLVANISNNSSIYGDYKNIKSKYSASKKDNVNENIRISPTRLGRSVYNIIDNIDLFALQKECNDYFSFIKMKDYNSLDAWFDASVIDTYFDNKIDNKDKDEIIVKESKIDLLLEQKIELLDDPDQLMKIIRKGRN